MQTLLSPLQIDDTDPLTDSAPISLLEMDQPVPRALSGEMLDVDLPWCSFDQEFRGYAETDWWSARNAPELALSFG